MSLAKLREQRARDMLAVIERRRTTLIPQFPDELRAASARELEWLAPEVDLRYAGETRQPAKLHASVAVVSPFTPSILIVTYTARYFIAPGAPPPAGIARDVYVVYGALRAAVLPEGRGTREL